MDGLNGFLSQFIYFYGRLLLRRIYNILRQNIYKMKMAGESSDVISPNLKIENISLFLKVQSFGVPKSS